MLIARASGSGSRLRCIAVRECLLLMRAVRAIAAESFRDAIGRCDRCAGVVQDARVYYGNVSSIWAAMDEPIGLRFIPG